MDAADINEAHEQLIQYEVEQLQHVVMQVFPNEARKSAPATEVLSRCTVAVE